MSVTTPMCLTHHRRFVPANRVEHEDIAVIMPSTIRGVNMCMIRVLGLMLTKAWRVLFGGVLVDFGGLQQTKTAIEDARERSDPLSRGCLVLPTHRSHCDYLLMSWIFFLQDMQVPRICAGENLNLPVLGQLLRWGGAFYIRRSFAPDGSYGTRIKNEICEMLASGDVVELFLEGGRSRHGAISSGKRGMLGLVAQLVLEGRLHDVTIIPAAVDYETLASSTNEDLYFASEQSGSPKQEVTLFSLLWIGLDLVCRDVFEALGFSQVRKPDIFVNFGKPISLRRAMQNGNCFESYKSDSESSIGVSAHLVCSQVITAQRSISFISYVAVVAATLLGGIGTPSSSGSSCPALALAGSSSTSEDDEVTLLERVGLLANLLREIAGMTPVRLFAAPTCIEKEVEAFEDALRVLSNVQCPRTVVETTAPKTTRIVERMRLRHACGELLPLLAPFSVVAFVLLGARHPSCLVTNSRRAILSLSSEVSALVAHAFPGGDFGSPSLGRAHDLLMKHVRPQHATQESMDPLLNTLCGVTLPAVEASVMCYLHALQSCVVGLPVSLEDLVKYTGEIRCASPEASSKHYLQNGIDAMCDERVFVELSSSSPSRKKSYQVSPSSHWSARTPELMKTVQMISELHFHE
jgi:1-acyl-sn-glycerol-3-phosphate acyltransferase